MEVPRVKVAMDRVAVRAAPTTTTTTTRKPRTAVAAAGLEQPPR